MTSPHTVPVTHAGVTRSVPIADAKLLPFLARALATFALPAGPSAPILAFQTRDQPGAAAVTTDLALALALGSPPLVGHLVLLNHPDLPTVDSCMHTVLRAVVDTAARRDAAAIFIALSGAADYLHHPQPQTQSQNQPSTQPQSHQRRPKPSPAPSETSAPLPFALSTLGLTSGPSSSQNVRRDMYARALDATTNLHPDLRASVVDAAVCEPSSSSPALADPRPLACFCTHTGVSCSKCHVQPITGTRYRRYQKLAHQLPSLRAPLINSSPTPPQPTTTSTTTIPATPAANTSASPTAVVNLCEPCRRSWDDCRDDDGVFVVYEHPWEASDEYAAASETGLCDALRVPPSPLRIGDAGPRVLHLHYVLHKVGYLSIANARFRPGVFCTGTRDAVGRLKGDDEDDDDDDDDDGHHHRHHHHLQYIEDEGLPIIGATTSSNSTQSNLTSTAASAAPAQGVVGEAPSGAGAMLPMGATGSAGGMYGVYDHLARAKLLSLVDMMEMRSPAARCLALSNASEPRLRMALAA